MRNAMPGLPFCRVCALVAKDAAKPAERGSGFFATASEILDDVLAGRGVSRAKVAQAINQGAWELGGDYAAASPDLANVDFGELFMGAAEKASNGARAKFQGAKNFTPPPGWFRPQQEDPEVARRRQAEQIARQVLGFGPTDTITLETVRARHRELAKKWHPDRFANDPSKQKIATTRMMEINNAVDDITAALTPPTPPPR